MENAIQHSIQLVKIQFPEFSLVSKHRPIELHIEEQFDLNLNFKIHFEEKEPSLFMVIFFLKLNGTHSFESNFTMHATFKVAEPINEDFKKSSLVTVNAPAIAFPFLRSFVTTITSNAGFNPVILPAINLTKLVPIS